MDVLHSEHGRRLLGWFLRRGLPLDDAEDCRQETWLRVQRALPDFEPRSPFGAFLRRVSHSVYVDWHRRQAVRRRVHVPLEAAGEHVARSSLSAGDRLDLRAAVGRLPPHLAEVLALTVWEGLGYREAAERLGVPHGTVKSRMAAAVQQLRARLHQQH